jgi:predicted nucleotidyltransferase
MSCAKKARNCAKKARKKNNTMLTEILSSKARAEIFRLLFNVTGIELHNREIVRRSGLGETGIRKELHNLVKLNLLNRNVVSNRTYYRANTDHPVYPDIHNLVIKTAGLVDVMKEALSDHKIICCFVYGSIASHDAKGRSDVDLMVIGNLGLRALSKLLSGVAEKVGREINPHVLTEKEFKTRIKKNDHFIMSVINSPKLFVTGSEDELKAMV